MAVDMFLKLADVKGESIDSKHKDETQVLAWSWGMSQTGTTHDGPGGGAGKVSVQDLMITKYVNKATPVLQLACCNLVHYPQAVLTIRKAGGEAALEYLKITLKEVIITSVSTSGNVGDDRLTENVALNFAEFKTEYTPQKADGSGDAVIEASYHIAQNVKQ